jgi:hypothetical protein
MRSSTHSRRLRPGERLVQMIWFMALRRGNELPMPTVERVNAIKLLVAAWAKEDAGHEEA